MNPIKRHRWGRRSAFAAATLAAAVAITAAERPSLLRAAPVGIDSVTTRHASTPGSATAKLDELSDAFATIAARVKPSVVYITSRLDAQPAANRSQRSPRGQRQPNLDQLPPELRDMLKGMVPEGSSPDDAPRPHGGGMASGSGFVVSNDGYILTNNHVVDGASEVRVRLLDRREFKAKVIGRDPNTDVAVIKIDATGLTPAPLGDSDASRVGEWVLAVGNPLGENLTFTVTQGIISAKGRVLGLPGQTQQTIQDFIQTDAAINPGNSGGPLVNTRGEVIGINSAIESPTGYNAGYGFAVPINLARAVMDQIVKTGRVQRVALGIQIRDASADDAAYVGLKDIGGVLVSAFADDNSAAKKAGMQEGDVIVAVDGKPVAYVAQLQELIAFRKPGDVATIEVARKGGQHATVKVPLQRAAEPDGREGVERRQLERRQREGLANARARRDCPSDRRRDGPRAQAARGREGCDRDGDAGRQRGGEPSRHAGRRRPGHHHGGGRDFGGDAGAAPRGAGQGEERRHRHAPRLQRAGEIEAR